MNSRGSVAIFSAGSAIRPSVFDLAGKERRIAEIEEQSSAPQFWNDRRAAEAALAELSALREIVREWRTFEAELRKEARQLDTLEALVREAGNEETAELQELIAESEKKLEDLGREIDRAELAEFLSGPYDANAATLSVFAGAGGRDAADWAAMLLRMFVRYAERRGWKVRELNVHRDPGGGMKSATIEIIGRNAYGWLRRESGVHRLVRISPFDASKRRHTSFALVEVLPVLPEADLRAIELKPEEIAFEAARASGPGGQNVNRRETAVRLTHLPTGIVVECQAERTQGANRERALAILKAKLATLRAEERRAALQRERGERVEAAWGNQIRSYVLHPYKLVRDHRTDVARHDPDAVLDGDLDSFIEAEIKL